MIDAAGRVAAHTGAKCIEAAGQSVGRNYSVQANMMLRASVWPAMARAFETTRGDLAERMLAAYADAIEQGRGAASLDGKMIDEASRKMAEKLALKGRAAGLG